MGTAETCRLWYIAKPALEDVALSAVVVDLATAAVPETALHTDLAAAVAFPTTALHTSSGILAATAQKKMTMEGLL